MMELLDEVDENGMPTGRQVERSEAHRLGIRHRTVHIWVLQWRDGRWYALLQKRAMNKESFPGRYDTSSAGHIQAGDEPLPSAVRELSEELGIAALPEELTYIGTFSVAYEKEFHGRLFKDREVAFVYVYRKPVDIRKLVIQKEELERVDWFAFEEICQACERKDKRFCVPRGGLRMVQSIINETK